MWIGGAEIKTNNSQQISFHITSTNVLVLETRRDFLKIQHCGLNRLLHVLFVSPKIELSAHQYVSSVSVDGMYISIFSKCFIASSACVVSISLTRL